MSTLLTPAVIEYPESDGQPMADNSLQFEWIVVLYGNLAALYAGRDDVFVCGNQNWFPREGEPDYFKAPDVYVVFGRPRGYRGSWKQWQEGGVPMTVVFEVLSPKNTIYEMADKLAFYDENGVEEYYVYDPDGSTLSAYLRGKAALVFQRYDDHFTSPRLGITFDLTGDVMRVLYPDGRRFGSFEELEAERAALEQRASTAEQRAARLAEISGKLLAQQATPEELAELQRLLGPSA